MSPALHSKPNPSAQFPKVLSSNVTINPVTNTTLPSYRRLITTLLPIRYQEKFYKDAVTNSTPTSLALCAQWHHPALSSKRKHAAIDNVTSPNATPSSIVVGGIQCRLEPTPTPPTDNGPAPSTHALYIQTLAVLSPYRSLGIATTLLNSVITIALTHYTAPTENVVEIYAHVWEANEDALVWYAKRGFLVEEAIMEGYYRRLRPSGARIVKRKVGVEDWLRAKEGNRSEGGKAAGGEEQTNGQKPSEELPNG